MHHWQQGSRHKKAQSTKLLLEDGKLDMFLQNKLKGRGGTPKRKISAKEYLKDSHMTKIIFSKFCNSVKAIYCKILLLFLIIFCFTIIFQLFVILNKVSKSAEIASLEFQLLIQEMEHGNIFSSVKIFSCHSTVCNIKQSF